MAASLFLPIIWPSSQVAENNGIKWKEPFTLDLKISRAVCMHMHFVLISQREKCFPWTQKERERERERETFLLAWAISYSLCCVFGVICFTWLGRPLDHSTEKAGQEEILTIGWLNITLALLHFPRHRRSKERERGKREGERERPILIIITTLLWLPLSLLHSPSFSVISTYIALGYLGCH